MKHQANKIFISIFICLILVYGWSLNYLVLETEQSNPKTTKLSEVLEKHVIEGLKILN